MKHLFLILLLTSGLLGETFDSMLNGLLLGHVPQVSTAQLVKELSSSEPPLLLDTREKGEFKVSHLMGAHFYGYLTPKKNVLKGVKRSTPIVTYCSVGKRSEDIGAELRKLGYTNVKNLRGGIFQWANEKRPIYTRGSKPTSSVHPYNQAWGKWLKAHVIKDKN